MNVQVGFRLNEKLYLKDPEGTELGRTIVKHAIELIYKLGYEHFTFKKLATQINTNEPSIYRYFENKYALLLYILNWYWSFMYFQVERRLLNLKNKEERIKTIIQLLTEELEVSEEFPNYNYKQLNQIVICEGSKAYFTKEVDEVNKNNVFGVYKDLCALIAHEFHEYNPRYKYCHSLSSTLIESAHQQYFFASHLPRLTDIKTKNVNDYLRGYLEHLVFHAIEPVKKLNYGQTNINTQTGQKIK